MIKIKITTADLCVEFDYEGSTAQSFILETVKQLITEAIEASIKIKAQG